VKANQFQVSTQPTEDPEINSKNKISPISDVIDDHQFEIEIYEKIYSSSLHLLSGKFKLIEVEDGCKKAFFKIISRLF